MPPVGSAAAIYDIARVAGVNPSTVSRDLNKPGRVSVKTEERIHAAAKALSYRLNPMARALPTGRTSTLGLLLADITNPMFFEVVRGAERIAPSVDGLILVATRLTDEQIRSLAERKRLVVINRRVDGIEEVVPDLEPGIDQALALLWEFGHRSVAFLSGPAEAWMSGARWRTVAEMARSRGMTAVEIGPGSPTLDGGRASLSRVIASGVTAVLAYNDLMAIGLLRAAQDSGVDVPGRLSIVGFDDIFGSDFTSPPLTTIRTPLDEMGERAARRALDLIDEALSGGEHAGPARRNNGNRLPNFLLNVGATLAALALLTRWQKHPPRDIPRRRGPSASSIRSARFWCSSCAQHNPAPGPDPG